MDKYYQQLEEIKQMNSSTSLMKEQSPKGREGKPSKKKESSAKKIIGNMIA